MTSRFLSRIAALIVLASGMAACSSSPGTPPAIPSTSTQDAALTLQAAVSSSDVGPEHAVCSDPGLDAVRCLAHQYDAAPTNADPNVSPLSILGYHPLALQTAYNLPSTTAGAGQTVAIVDAYDDPNAESDLAVYRAKFGLGACTTQNGCFKKLNQLGAQGSYPTPNTGWSEEISLDLDMVSAICPKCHITLVEANSNSFADIAASVDTAANTKPNAISNSYGGAESAGSVAYNSHYNHPGIAITASSGDNGYGVEFPADSQYVTAVGGTTLRASRTAPRGWTETAWSGAGSGCSALIGQPAWQMIRGCTNRIVADVSAVANPSTGVSVYDTYGVSGWLVFGGTSVSSPIIASVYALAGNSSSIVYGSYPYAHTASLFDVVGGSNGSCSVFLLCHAVVGYDGPTGLGTPNGSGAF